MIAYPTSVDYDETVKEGFWVADFYTSVCGPCKLIDRMLSEIVEENPDINWAKCNLERDWSMQEKYNVPGTPTLIFYLDGKERGRMIGGFHSMDELEEAISGAMFG